MDRDIVLEKLESLRHCLNRIEDKRPSELKSLQSDVDLQDIITLNLTRAVQLCVDIGAHILAGGESAPPATMGETFEKLAELEVIDSELMTRMKKAVGFRNIAVHGYGKIDYEIVFQIIHKNLADFKHYAQAIVKATLS
ncbi:MAG: DUF86 domain-containing protein [Gammaproteobacteria bacterium]